MVINGVLFHTFLIFANSRFYMNEPLKRTNCLQKSFDSVWGWDKRMDALHLSVFHSVSESARLFFGSVSFQLFFFREQETVRHSRYMI